MDKNRQHNSTSWSESASVDSNTALSDYFNVCSSTETTVSPEISYCPSNIAINSQIVEFTNTESLPILCIKTSKHSPSGKATQYQQIDSTGSTASVMNPFARNKTLIQHSSGVSPVESSDQLQSESMIALRGYASSPYFSEYESDESNLDSYSAPNKRHKVLLTHCKNKAGTPKLIYLSPSKLDSSFPINNPETFRDLELPSENIATSSNPRYCVDTGTNSLSPDPRVIFLKKCQLDEKEVKLKKLKEDIEQEKAVAQRKAWEALERREILYQKWEKQLKNEKEEIKVTLQEVSKINEETDKLSEKKEFQFVKSEGLEQLKEKFLCENISKNDHVPIGQPASQPALASCKASIIESPFGALKSFLNTDAILNKEPSLHSKTKARPGRKPKKPYFPYDLGENLPSFEPSKIIRTYSRSVRKKEVAEEKQIKPDNSIKDFTGSNQYQSDLHGCNSANSVSQGFSIDQPSQIVSLSLPKTQISECPLQSSKFCSSNSQVSRIGEISLPCLENNMKKTDVPYTNSNLSFISKDEKEHYELQYVETSTTNLKMLRDTNTFSTGNCNNSMEQNVLVQKDSLSNQTNNRKRKIVKNECSSISKEYAEESVSNLLKKNERLKECDVQLDSSKKCISQAMVGVNQRYFTTASLKEDDCIIPTVDNLPNPMIIPIDPKEEVGSSIPNLSMCKNVKLSQDICKPDSVFMNQITETPLYHDAGKNNSMYLDKVRNESLPKENFPQSSFLIRFPSSTELLKQGKKANSIPISTYLSNEEKDIVSYNVTKETALLKTTSSDLPRNRTMPLNEKQDHFSAKDTDVNSVCNLPKNFDSCPSENFSTVSSASKEIIPSSHEKMTEISVEFKSRQAVTIDKNASDRIYISPPKTIISTEITCKNDVNLSHLSDVENLELISNLPESFSNIKNLKSRSGRKIVQRIYNTDDFLDTRSDCIGQDSSSDQSFSSESISNYKKHKRKSASKRNRCLKKSPKHIERISKKRKCSNITDDTQLENDSAFLNWICGKCDQLFTSENDFSIHISKVHNGLARLKGESQMFDEESANKAIAAAFLRIKNLDADEPPRLTCEVCFKKFASFCGFQYHYRRKVCQDSLVQCTTCLLKMRPFEIRNHEKTHLARSQTSTSDDNDMTAIDKRHIKKRACKNLYLNDLPHPKDLDDDIDPSIRKFYRIEQAFIVDNAKHIAQFKNSLKKSKTGGRCINDQCTARFKECKKLKMHLKVCSKAPLNYFCSLCKFKASSSSIISAHITSNHDKYLTGVSEGEASDVDSYGIESKETDTDIRRLYRRCQSKYEVYYKAKEMTLEFRKNNYSSVIHENFQSKRSDWIELEEHEAQIYLPTIKESPCFRFSNSNSTIKKWEKLNIFDGRIVNSERILFCGGPVSSLAWCPMPDEILSENQVLAVACQGDPKVNYPLSDKKIHEGLIQIWNCGNFKCFDSPKMCFSIAHNFGISWALEWCPSGIYDLEKISLDQCQYPRLGLLASCFSDGSIRIFCIPKIDWVAQDKENVIYKKHPDLSLFMHDVKGLQCTNLSWSSSKGHDLIAGSFTNGVVSIWDLKLNNSLLKSTDVEGNAILYPIRSLKAHQGVCSTVSFCPSTQGQHLVTGGNDRIIRFWDLNKPDHPLAAPRKGLTTKSVWVPHWAGAMVAFDDVFSLAKTCTSFRENGFFGLTHRHILATNATVFGLAMSDWHNALVHVDEGGEVVMSFQHSLTCTNQSEKHTNRKRFPLFSTKLENLDSGEEVNLLEEYENNSICDEHVTPKKLKQIPVCTEPKPNKLTVYPASYNEVASEFGVKFVAHNTTKCVDNSSKQYSHQMDPGPLTIYPLNGATSVSWNNNRDSNSWIVVGMKSGFCRVIHIPLPEK